MSVLIRGEKMPEDCWECCSLQLDHCDGKWTCVPEERPKECPLVEIPEPHGRLIEEAAAIETTWMILRGLGYLKGENPQLEQTVRKVFATVPAIEVE